MILALPDGRIVPGPRHGGSGGTVTSFRLGADEYITGISGRSGDYIDSLRIHTNRRESPLFGGSGGNRDFRIVVPEGNQAVGFVGRAGDYIDAVGLAYTPIRVSRSRPVSPVAPGFSSELGLTALAGGRGGKPFQDSALPAGGRIAEIQIRAGERIDAVQVIYTLPSGRYQEGVLHGGSGGAANVFRLDPDEYVIGISGRCGDTIDSLRIHTNRRSSPLYGGGGGSREYRIDVPRGTRAVGFAGRAGDQVDAIALTFVREGR
jgi:hypothetical protein